MRKRTFLAAVLTAALLTGCGTAAPGGSAAPALSGEPPEMGSANRTPVPAAEVFRFELDSRHESDRLTAEDGTELASYSYVLPVLRVEKEDGTALESALTEGQQRALDAADTFNSEMEDWAESVGFPETLEWAEDDYELRLADGLDWHAPYSYSEEFTYTFWRTDRLLSIAGNYYSYTGGAHPNSVYLSWLFDLKTGRFLHATALGGDAEGFQQAVTEELIRQTDRRAIEEDCAPTELYWENYQEILAEWPYAAVTFSGEGMTVTFSPYELAPYAAGEQVYSLSMDFLEPYLSADGRELLGLAPEAG